MSIQPGSWPVNADPAATAVLRGIVARLDGDELVESAVADVRAEVDAYRLLPDRVADEKLKRSARAAVTLFTAILLAETTGADSELLPFRTAAIERAAEGISLEEFLHGIRMLAGIVWQALIAAAETAEEQTTLLAASGTILTFIDRVASTVTVTYLQERQFRVSEDARLAAELIDALAAGGPVPETLRAFATRIGAPVLELYVAFALTRPGVSAVGYSQEAAALRLSGVLAISDGDAVIGVSDPEARPATLSGEGALVALGEPTRRGDLQAALQDVRLLLRIARGRGQLHGVVDAVQVAVPLLVAGSPRLARQLRRRLLGPLEAYEGGGSGEMLRSLRTYFAQGMNRSRTAAALGVHPNTLDYRLGRLEDLCKVKLTDPGDITRIEIALAVLDQEQR